MGQKAKRSQWEKMSGLRFGDSLVGASRRSVQWSRHMARPYHGSKPLLRIGRKAPPLQKAQERGTLGSRDGACFIAEGRATRQPLRLEKTIPLPDVKGRIDHMAVNVKGEKLLIAALGNNTVEVIDLKTGKRAKTIGQLQEPQGLLYVAETNRLYVANGKDGSVRIFDASSYAPLNTLNYGDDADNLRYDSGRKRIYVGYGGGALEKSTVRATRSVTFNSMPIQNHSSWSFM
jgi:YVTN family beta-propeller protein